MRTSAGYQTKLQRALEDGEQYRRLLAERTSELDAARAEIIHLKQQLNNQYIDLDV